MSMSRWPFTNLDRFLDEAIRAQNASLTPFEEQQNSRLLKPRYARHASIPPTRYRILTVLCVQDGPPRGRRKERRHGHIRAPRPDQGQSQHRLAQREPHHLRRHRRDFRARRTLVRRSGEEVWKVFEDYQVARSH